MFRLNRNPFRLTIPKRVISHIGDAWGMVMFSKLLHLKNALIPMLTVRENGVH